MSALAASPSAHEVLPPELWLQVTALSRPRPRLASTCKELHSMSLHNVVQWAWRNHILLGQQPQSADGGEIPPLLLQEWRTIALNSTIDYHHITHVHFVHLLRRRLPQHPQDRVYAAEMAPSTPFRDSLLSPDFVQGYLFASSGPILRSISQQQLSAPDHLSLTLSHLDQLMEQMYFEDRSESEKTQVLPDLFKIYRWWSTIPHALHLIMYFFRSGQIDLFEFALAFLADHLPAVLAARAPLTHWFMLSLDNREDMTTNLWQLYSEEANPLEQDDPEVELGIFLMLLSLVEWSSPALVIVMSKCNVGASDLAAWSFGGSVVQDVMGQTMCECDRAERIVNMCQFLHENAPDAAFDMFPMIDGSRGLRPAVALRLLIELDIPASQTTHADRAIALHHAVIAWILDGGDRLMLDTWISRGLATQPWWYLFLKRASEVDSPDLVCQAIEGAIDRKQVVEWLCLMAKKERKRSRVVGYFKLLMALDFNPLILAVQDPIHFRSLQLQNRNPSLDCWTQSRYLLELLDAVLEHCIDRANAFTGYHTAPKFTTLVLFVHDVFTLCLLKAGFDSDSWPLDDTSPIIPSWLRNMSPGQLGVLISCAFAATVLRHDSPTPSDALDSSSCLALAVHVWTTSAGHIMPLFLDTIPALVRDLLVDLIFKETTSGQPINRREELWNPWRLSFEELLPIDPPGLLALAPWPNVLDAIKSSLLPLDVDLAELSAAVVDATRVLVRMNPEFGVASVAELPVLAGSSVLLDLERRSESAVPELKRMLLTRAQAIFGTEEALVRVLVSCCSE
ncbi:hypothetical protein BCR44DRAFT_66739 [Catenaria anguillulae PL171]|uniref:Uncharacterized protein n=1 Tax=Catenaria anguillulae PL171 TaxID=765915 RepID=A0A1Y2HR40_9FUNG|nr:hypothetical protein BCR44DRAFT_66739 [Catenaria anguillulae PL171]